ncbi:hypothetical protein AMTR_s00060p00173650, partial [Amborella trichopoda]
SPDVFTYNTMIKRYSETHELENAISLYPVSFPRERSADLERSVDFPFFHLEPGLGGFSSFPRLRGSRGRDEPAAVELDGERGEGFDIDKCGKGKYDGIGVFPLQANCLVIQALHLRLVDGEG